MAATLIKFSGGPLDGREVEYCGGWCHEAVWRTPRRFTIKLRYTFTFDASMRCVSGAVFAGYRRDHPYKSPVNLRHHKRGSFPLKHIGPHDNLIEAGVLPLGGWGAI